MNMMNGIDVSNYQGKIDWSKVKASGKNFVIIRAGWGQNSIDPNFYTYIDGAIAQGLKVGIYWFLYAKSEKDIINNANKCNSIIAPYKDKISMKVWADWEYDSDNWCGGLSKSTRTAWVKKFCETMKGFGYDVGIYANPDYLKNKFTDISEYPLWLAYYANSKGSYNPFMWQNSSKGKVDGIKGNVDTDICYVEETIAPIVEVDVPKTTETYVVKSGDTLSKIANAYKTTVDELMKLNPQIKNKNLIDKGAKITVPINSVPINSNASVNQQNPYKEPLTTLKYKHTGEGVKWLQWQLRYVFGYEDVVVDGIFGNITDKRVREVQKNAKITVDGKVGINTRKVLKK